MIKDNSVFLKHIRDNADLIQKNISDLSYEDFKENIPIQDAVIRRLEITGEAIRNLTDEFKQKYPGVPWREIVDTRNKLIHDYFGVDLKLVWEMATIDIVTLNKKVKEILENL